MSKVKKIFSLFLVVILVWTISGANMVFAQEVAPTFEIGNYDGVCGDTIQVPVVVKGNPGISAMRLSVEYDADRIELTAITFNSAWGGLTTPPQSLTSPVLLGWGLFTSDYTVADSTFATLTFKVLEDAEPGDAEIRLTYDPNDVYNLAEENIEFSVSNGYITVKGNETCDHENTSTAYTDNKDGSHMVTVTCGDCGELVSEISETCTDKTGDNECDSCGAMLDQAASSSFEIGYFEGACGDIVQVPIEVNGNPGISAMRLSVEYDADRIELTAITFNSAWGGLTTPPQSMTSPVLLGWGLFTSDYTVADSTFATLTFKVLEDAEPGDAEIKITYDPNDVYNLAEENIEFAVINGKIVVEGETVHTHTPGTAVHENEVAASCKETGSYDEVVYCTDCGEELSRVEKTIPKLTTHTPGTAVRENEVAATCKAAGSYDEVKYCSVCGVETSRVEKTIPKLTTHTPSTAVRENEVAATCKAGGSYDAVTYCSVCKVEISRVKKTIPQLTTHTPGTAVRENEVAATCKATGSYDEVVYCSVCDAEISRVEKTIPKLTTHTPGTAVRENEVAATCKAAGSYDSVTYCTVCDTEISRVEKTIPKLTTHTPGATVRENEVTATCKTAGAYDEVIYCTACDTEISRVEKTLPKLNTHTPGTAVRENEVAATCKTAGSYDEVKYCTVCDVETNRTKKTIAKLTTHTPGTAVRENEVAATCKVAGSYDEVKYCTVCGVETSRVEKTVPKLTTHTPGTTVSENEVAATCKAAGSYDEVVYCSICDIEISRAAKTIDKLTTHTPGTAVRENEVAATCKEAGSYDKVVYCSVCDTEISRTEKTIDKLTTHTPSDWIIDEEPTRFEDGLKHKECEICGEILEEAIIPSEDDRPHYSTPIFPFIPNDYEDEDLPFYDVSERDYYYDAVAWAYRNDITGGVSNNRFAPDQSCTRAQAVTFLWRAAGSPRAYDRTMNFVDVPYNSYYYDAVLWAVERGIVTGVSATHFAPDAVCTRAQIVTMLWRLNGERSGDDVSFVDVKNGAYYAEAVKWAVSYGITQGTGNNTFSPDAVCTRAQIVTFLWRNEE